MDRVSDFADRSHEADFDRAAFQDDDSASRKLLASGQPIEIAYDDTPPEHIVRIHPDGREELIKVNRSADAKVLGA